MDGDTFHRNVLLTAFVLKQVVLARHHTVCTGITDERQQNDWLCMTVAFAFLHAREKPYLSNGESAKSAEETCHYVKIMSEPEDAVSCSHDVESTNDGASTDVVVVTVIVCVPLKRHLQNTEIGHLG